MFLRVRAWRWGNYGYGNPWAGGYSAEQLATLASQTARTHTITAVQDVTSVNTATVVKTVTTGGQSSQATPSLARTTVQTGTTATQATTTMAKVPLSRDGTSSGTTLQFVTSAADHITTSPSPSPTALVITVSEDGPTVTSGSSGSTARPITTHDSSSSSSSSSGMGKGEIAAIVLAILFVVSLCAMLSYVWRRRKAGHRSASGVTLYAFSTATATATVVEGPPHTPTFRPISPEWTVHADVAESTPAATTFASPTVGASGYEGGRAVYPLDEKSRDPHAPSPRSSTAFALSSSPMSPFTRAASPHPISPPPATHSTSVGTGPSTLPYAWDRPPPSSEYLPRTSGRRSRFIAESGLPPGLRGSFGTVSSEAPAYSSGVPGLPEAGTRPPSYSRY